MKARVLISLMALGAILAASCAKDAPRASVASPAPIAVKASVSNLTKAQTDAQGVTTFQEGDQLTLYAWTGSAAEVPAQKVVNGVVNSFDGNKWTPESMMLWKNVFDAHYFLGIFPARVVTSFTADPVFASVDLLVATVLGDGIVAPQTTTAPPVDLVFDHVFAKLNVNIKYRNQWGLNPETSVYSNAVPAGTIDYLTKVITPAGVNEQQMAATETANGYDATFTSFVIPQEGVRSFTFNVQGTQLKYTHPEDLPFEAGKVTTISVLVGKDKIDIVDSTVADWSEGEVDENMNKNSGIVSELTRPLTLRAKEDGTTVTFTDRSSGNVNWITSDGRSGRISLVNKTVSLSAGQRVWFVGDGSNNAFGTGAESTSSRIAIDKDCEVYGNIMSLLGPDFATATTLPAANTFAYLFSGQTHLKNNPEEGLILPATTLTEGCYRGMFKGCTGLGQVVVNATDISAQYCTRGWLDGVTADKFGLVTVDPLIWTMGDNLPLGATVYTGEEKIFTAPTPKAPMSYNTAAQTLINDGTAYKEGVVLEYSTDGSSWSTAVPTGTNAGSYTAYCHVKGGVTSAAISATIAAKVVTSPTITLATTSYNYDGTAKTPAVSSVKDGGNTIPASEYTVSYSNNINAGTATVTITDKTGGNYTVSGSKNFTINKIACTVSSAPTAKSLTFNGNKNNYNGSAQTLINAGTASNGSMQYKLGSGSWGTSLPSATNAGTYTVYYKAVGSNSNYSDSAEGSVQVTITKADGFIESTLTTYSTNVFGGNTGTVYASGELSGYVMTNAMGKNMNLTSNNTTPPSYSVSVSTTGPFSYIMLVFSCKESANYKAVDKKSISLTLQ